MSATATRKGIEHAATIVTVTKGSYKASKGFTFRVYGLEVTTTSLRSGNYGTSYKATLEVSKYLPSNVGSLTYYASGLHAGLSLNSSTGVISGIPTTWGNNNVSVYAVQSPYRSATKTLSLSIASPPPGFTAPDSEMTISAYNCKQSSVEGSSLGTLNINGYGFTQYNYALSCGGSTSAGSLEIIVNGGDTSVKLPRVQVSTNVVNDNQLRLNFVLNRRSTGTEAALKDRARTILTILMYKTSFASPIARHTVGVRFI